MHIVNIQWHNINKFLGKLLSKLLTPDQEFPSISKLT
jgi:hypothetical protein